jgi:hypothetical protein
VRAGVSSECLTEQGGRKPVTAFDFSQPVPEAQRTSSAVSAFTLLAMLRFESSTWSFCACPTFARCSICVLTCKLSFFFSAKSASFSARCVSMVVTLSFKRLPCSTHSCCFVNNASFQLCTWSRTAYGHSNEA